MTDARRVDIIDELATQSRELCKRVAQLEARIARLEARAARSPERADAPSSPELEDEIRGRVAARGGPVP